MRAGHQTRRFHSRKQTAAVPGEGRDMQVFDLTQTETLSLIDFCREAPAEMPGIVPSFHNTRDIFSWIAALLAQSPTGIALLRHAAERGWSAGSAELHTGGFFLDTERRRILVDGFSMAPDALSGSLYFRNAFLMTFIRALRDVWHEQRGSALESGFSPEHILMLERARAADCDVAAVLVCWELRGAGFSDIWRHLLGSAEGDMAMIFTRYLERDPGALFDGSALAYAFRQWYADDARVDGCDHETLETLDDILSGSDARNPFGGDTPMISDVEALALLPDGVCYLAGLGNTVLRDPFFSGMKDPVNQTHLFHLIYDMEVTMVNNVPFRDSALARRIFPGAEIVKSWR
jgi:hypothetical protein